MNLSRFFGSTNREVLRQVRMALGPDALIVSNRRVNGGVEIMAADATSLPAGVQDPDSNKVREPDSNVIEAIGAMRGALETRIDEVLWGSQLRRAPEAVQVFQTMLGCGFSTALLRAMLKRLPAHLSPGAAFQWARNEIVTHLPVLESENDLWAPGLALALVGPTGIGKTTTIAKLAARCAKRFGARNVTLLTTDTYRIGAHEQLKIYGRMMQLAVHVVQDADELRRVVQELGPDQIILIDNVGVSQRDHYISQQASLLAAAGRPVKRILVVNASSNGDTLDEVARSYSNDGGSPLTGCIITKLDEATRLAAALDTAIRYQLPIHYVSSGQKVPEDLLLLSAADLVDRALAGPTQTRPLYAPTQADFAAIMSLVKVPQPDSTVADDRRKQLLPSLLCAVGGANFVLSEPELKDACLFFDDDPACSKALDLWRDYVAPVSPAPTDSPIENSIENMVRCARNYLAGIEHRHVLAIHDCVSLKLRSNAHGHLRATALLTEHARALTSPIQQLALADGWRSSCGLTSLEAPRPSDALYHQVQWLAQRCDRMSLVHVFGSATPALRRRLSLEGTAWLTQCPGATKVQFDSCATTLSALAKTLVFRPMEQPGQSVQLTQFNNLAISDCVFWIGSEVVEAPMRQGGAPVMHMISLRIVDRRDGRQLKVLYGLSNMLPTRIEPDLLGAWLVVQSELGKGFQYAASFWRLLAQHEQQPALHKRALTAMQLGLAAWQIRQSDNARQVRAIVSGLTGRSVPTAQAMASATLKLFTLKEMLA